MHVFRRVAIPFAAGVAAGIALDRLMSGRPAGRTPQLHVPEQIVTIADLRRHLEVAIRLELSTIPPYLYAGYSLHGHGRRAAGSLFSIVLEEMLHLTYACNLLLATGGTPRLYARDRVPVYPSVLPNRIPELTVHLMPVGVDTLDGLLAIELPESPARTAAHGKDPRLGCPKEESYPTIGLFYADILHCFERLDATVPDELWARPQRRRQFYWFEADPPGDDPVTAIERDSFNVTGTARDPRLGPVTRLEHARNAIRSVTVQGEGNPDSRWADPDHEELAHYYKLEELRRWFVQGHDDRGRDLRDAVWPCAVDPRAAAFPDRLRRLADFGNAAYCYLLLSLDHIYRLDDGDDRREEIAEENFETLMTDIVGPVARLLSRQQLPGTNRHAGLSFEFHDFAADPVRSPREQLAALWNGLEGDDRGELEGCGDRIGGLVDVGLIPDEGP